ncbi:unnamed protein product [Kuraishia capsulata CBS 1993]|uniref:Uncharacterized protein n=1 Tax=Kuraishia capsulata CBS 1993 TaxID=1382522 RepID=W6MQ90_9ASCO|nr:uncharacterized protein KUCA_T00000020001 [Kuraishia capsulata CBS 1993]CDK24060.1 unnamed protein product [Kuraishia capsulata CBS 1993]
MTNLTKLGLKPSSPPGILAKSAKEFHISQSVIIPAGLATVETSGIVGFDEEGNIPADIKTEIHNAFKNIETALKHAGVTGGFKSVYHMNSYHTDFSEEHVAALDAATAEFFGEEYPTWAGIEIKGLSEGAHIEIEVRAIQA